jgi:Holliday junction resolvase
MANANKAKGSQAERQVRDFLQQQGVDCDRVPAGATKDVGDIFTYDKKWPAIQVKNHKTIQLGVWVTEAQQQAEHANRLTSIVVHKRKGKGSPADWYVTTTLQDFVNLMKGAQ